MNKELQRDIESQFGKNFDRLGEADLTELYNQMRTKMRELYLRSRATTFKICDKCAWTFPKLTDSCKNCGGDLRAFEVPFDGKFTKVDFMAEGKVQAK